MLRIEPEDVSVDETRPRKYQDERRDIAAIYKNPYCYRSII